MVWYRIGTVATAARGKQEWIYVAFESRATQEDGVCADTLPRSGRLVSKQMWNESKTSAIAAQRRVDNLVEWDLRKLTQAEPTNRSSTPSVVGKVGCAVSVVIPARNAQDFLRRCLAHLNRSTDCRFEVIVVDDASSDATSNVAEELGARVIRLATRSGPAAARNRGTVEAREDILVFVDADVLVQPDTIGRLADRLKHDCDAVFGSYDVHPTAPNLVSQYKNLLHHFVHQQASRQAGTFWAGCGAILASKFAEVGGFSETYHRPCIEDIELGVRLKNRGYRIELDPDIQVTHLKHWTFKTMLWADVFDRALPWTQLILEQGAIPNDLNLKTSQRICAVLALAAAIVCTCIASLRELSLLLLPLGSGFALLVADAVGMRASHVRFAERSGAILLVGVFAIFALKLPFVTGLLSAMLMGIVILNQSLFRFFFRHRGLAFTILSLPLQVLYYCYSSMAFGWACTRYGLRRIWGWFRKLTCPRK